MYFFLLMKTSFCYRRIEDYKKEHEKAKRNSQQSIYNFFIVVIFGFDLNKNVDSFGLPDDLDKEVLVIRPFKTYSNFFPGLILDGFSTFSSYLRPLFINSQPVSWPPYVHLRTTVFYKLDVVCEVTTYLADLFIWLIGLP